MQVFDEAPAPELPRPMTPIVQLHSHPTWVYVVFCVCLIAATLAYVDRALAY